MENKLYLPVSDETLLRLTVSGHLNQEELTLLKGFELAAVLVLCHLPSMKEVNHVQLEKALAGIIQTARDYQRGSNAPFLDEVKSRITFEWLTQGMNIAKSNRIYTLPIPEIRDANFITREGEWDYQYKGRYTHPVEQEYTVTLPRGQKRSFQSEQMRIFKQLSGSVSDEHVQVQGYSGSGKTFMLSNVADVLLAAASSKRRVLALFRSTGQRDAGKARLPSSVVCMSFAQLANYMIPDYADPNTLRLKSARDRGGNPHDDIVRILNLRPVKLFDPHMVSRALFQIVARFTVSRDQSIERKHLPLWIGNLSEVDEAYLLSHASMLWEFIINPPENFPIEIPVRDHHLVKFIEQKGYRIPHVFSHILIDESHDVSGAMLSIIERSPQGCFGLGDEIQAFGPPPSQRQTPAISRVMQRSYRVPGDFDRFVNFFVDMHPTSIEEEFLGNRDRKAKLEFYEAPPIPEEPTAIWVEDEWELFEWVNKLADAGISIRLAGSIEGLDRFVRGVIELYRKNEPVRVIGLSNYRNWNDVMSGENQLNRSIRTINKWLEQGYTTKHWKKAAEMFDPQSEYVVGLFENSKNREFRRVMLAPAIIRQFYKVKTLGDSNSPEAKAARKNLSSRLYLGITRTTETLIVPETLNEFMHFI